MDSFTRGHPNRWLRGEAMSVEHEVVCAIRKFVSSRRAVYDEFPSGGSLPIPQPVERSLLEVLERNQPIDSSTVSASCFEFSTGQADDLVIFSVRMAIYAARASLAHVLRAGMIGLVLDDNVLDERDLLSALSIIEDCASRIGADMQK